MIESNMRTMSLSESAAERVAVLRDQEGNPSLMLRVKVMGGGCSGFQYIFGFDDVINDDDHIFEKNGVKLVVDDVSLDLLNGAEVDYAQSLMAAAFVIKNPNAASSCGCGSSFSV